MAVCTVADVVIAAAGLRFCGIGTPEKRAIGAGRKVMINLASPQRTFRGVQGW